MALLVPASLAGLAAALAGFVASGILDAMAGRSGEALRFFTRLRPLQDGIPAASLALMLLDRLT